MVAVVPKSLVKPVPASRARSAIQAQIDASRARVERLNERTKRQLVRQLLELERELRDRLDKLRREGRGDAWTSADTEATLVQVRELLGRQGREFGALLGENTVRARALGVRSTVGVLQHFEGVTGGPIRPLALAAAIAAQDPLLARHPSSVARYGLRTIERVAGVMQRGLLEGATFDEMKKRLTSGPGPLVQSAGDAARIVRTEGMFAYNAGAHEEALAQRAARFPDLQKKLVETFDIRTAEDSRAAHGQVKDLEDLFVDGAGRRYLHPPGRPNDRGVCIPYRMAWEEGSTSTAAPAPAPAPAPVPAPLPPLPPSPERLPERPRPDVVTSPPEGERAFARRNRAQIEALPEAQRAAISDFTFGYDWVTRRLDRGTPHDEILRDLRKAWKAGTVRRLDTSPEAHLEKGLQVLYHLRLARQALPASPGVAYRGLANMTRAQVGAFLAQDELTLGAISSVSRDPKVASRFATSDKDSGHGVLLVIRHHDGRAIEEGSVFSSEKELLLDGAARFRVVSRHREQGSKRRWIVEIEQTR